MSRTRLPHLILLVTIPIVFVALFVLASSLSQLKLQTDSQAAERFQYKSATPEATVEPSLEGSGGAGIPPDVISEPPPRLVRILILVALAVSFIYLMATKDGRRKMKSILYYALWVGAVFYVIRNYAQEVERVDPSTFDRRLTDPLTRVLPPTPILLTWGISLFIALSVGVILWRIFGRIQPPQPDPHADLIANAQQTITRLDQADDVRNTILDCYRTMLSQAQRLRGIKRNRSVTALEFEKHLMGYGFPARETSRLTRLFEKVRYSNREATSAERREARDCLTTFIAAAQQKQR